MNHHRLRRTAAQTLEPVLPYTSYGIDEREFLFEFDGTLDEFRAVVESHGYHYQLFAAIKDLDGVEDDGSYARIARSHPPEADGTALEKLDPRECQYHIHPFVTDDTIRVYGHYEIHPYPWTPDWDTDRPKRHYRPKKRPSYESSNVTYIRGIVDGRLSKET